VRASAPREAKTTKKPDSQAEYLGLSVGAVSVQQRPKSETTRRLAGRFLVFWEESVKYLMPQQPAVGR